MNDDFKSLKTLGKKINKTPSTDMMNEWMRTPFTAGGHNAKKTNWWQIAAALVAGILIGKFILQSSPDIFAVTAKNNVEDETFEYIYTNN